MSFHLRLSLAIYLSITAFTFVVSPCPVICPPLFLYFYPSFSLSAHLIHLSPSLLISPHPPLLLLHGPVSVCSGPRLSANEGETRSAPVPPPLNLPHLLLLLLLLLLPRCSSSPRQSGPRGVEWERGEGEGRGWRWAQKRRKGMKNVSVFLLNREKNEIKFQNKDGNVSSGGKPHFIPPERSLPEPCFFSVQFHLFLFQFCVTGKNLLDCQSFSYVFASHDVGRWRKAAAFVYL